MLTILKFVGAAIFVWGLIDLGMSWSGVDVWGLWLGVQLPDLIWRYSAYFALIVGGMTCVVAYAETIDDFDEH